jgi:hypothetical protein
MSRVDEEVEKFIRRYYDLELIIKPEALTIMMDGQKPFADCLQRAMLEYMLGEKENETIKKARMGSVFAYMTKAYSYGIVSPGQELLGKLDECRKQNMEIRRDLAICTANYVALQKKYDRLMGMLDQNQAEGLKNEESASDDSDE